MSIILFLTEGEMYGRILLQKQMTSAETEICLPESIEGKVFFHQLKVYACMVFTFFGVNFCSFECLYFRLRMFLCGGFTG